ncbi:NAD(P)/FAD-dependent oxidoreductase [soil metagenome]
MSIVGTGFSGLGMAIRLEQKGVEYTVFERRDDLGGTWFDNTYPGCKCDVPSHLYSFSFAPNPEWSHTYSPQPEIWEYLRRTADEHGVVDKIRFGHEVLGTVWAEDRQRWRIETSQGTWTADVLVAGQGALSEPAIPEIAGLDRFEGAVFHSAEWDHDHDLSGERVAVIGTGASAIQFVPPIQPDVGQLSLFQRTPPWVLPHTDRPVTRAERAVFRRFPAVQRLVRTLVYWARELVVFGLVKNRRWMKPTERLGRMHLEKQVKDPELRAKLTPDYSPGCKRLLLSNDYYPSLGADNVEVVTDAIEEVRPTSVVTADGREHPADTIIFGTGFKVTKPPVAHLVHGRDGRTLADVWAERGMQAYLGTTVAGFPNLFMLAGPNTGIGHTSLVVMIEAQIGYVLGALRLMEERDLGSVEPREEPFAAFNDELQRKMRTTVWSTGHCASWYLDDQGRNPTLWPDFTWRFTQRTRRFDPDAYHLVGRADRASVAGGTDRAPAPAQSPADEPLEVAADA